MLSEKFLSENFYETDNDLEKLRSLMREVQEHTKFQRIRSDDLKIMSYKCTEGSKLNFYELNPVDLFYEDGTIKHRVVSFDKNSVLKRGNFVDLITETENNTKFMLYDDFKLYFVSPNIFSTMDRFGLSSDLLAIPDKARDDIIARQFHKKAQNCTLVTREYNKNKKVFAVLSGKYTDVKQETLIDVIDKISNDGTMGKAKCYKWGMSHFITSIYVEFPEKAKQVQDKYKLKDNVIPGLWLATSDTGDCSVKIRGTWRTKNSITIHQEIKKKHLGEVNPEKILEEVDKVIFSEYCKLPEALCDLLMQDITDTSWDLTTPSGQLQNRTAIKNTVKNLFNDIGMVKAIGKKEEKVLYERVMDKFDPSMHYTAYDIAISILNLPSRIAGESVKKANLQKACGLAPYAKYDTTKSTPKIVLTA